MFACTEEIEDLPCEFQSEKLQDFESNAWNRSPYIAGGIVRFLNTEC